MKIQKKKILSNLIKIQILKKKYSSIQYYPILIQTIHSLFLIYLVIVNSNAVLRNPIFLAFKSLNTFLLSFTQIPVILSSILLSFSLFMVLSFFYLILEQDRVNFQENKFKIQRLVLRTIASISILFDIAAPIFLVVIISNTQLNDINSFLPNSIHFACLMLCEFIIVYCTQLLIYTNKFIILLLVFQFSEGVLSYWILICFTCFELYRTKFNKLSYLLVLIVAFVILLAEEFQADINAIYMAILFVSIVLINFTIPSNGFSDEEENQNDFLLEMIGKLSKDEDLTNQQNFKIVFVLENMQIRHKQHINLQQRRRNRQYSSTQITKNQLISLLTLKLDIDARVNPNDFNIKIQYYECQLFEKPFSIVTLYQIEKLNIEVENRCVFDELFRMQAFLNKIQVEYLHSEDDINSALIFSSEKKLQRFYECIGLCIEQMITLWKTVSSMVISQEIFNRSLKKVISLQQQSFQILKNLKKFKNVNFQIEIINFLHRIINVDGDNIMETEAFIHQERLKQTKFILVSNQIIEDISHIIAKEITSNEQPLIGLNFSQVLYDFYNVFLHQQMNYIVSISSAHHQILIPFKVLNHQKKFFLSECTISILPDLTNGVKYIVNFGKQKQYIKKYAIYCLEDDSIQGLSQTFYEVFKIDETLLPQILLGRQIFNIDLSSHINEQNIVKNAKIKCDLFFNDLRKKKKTTKRSKEINSIPLVLTIRDIYKVKNLHYILFQMETKQETLVLTAKETIKTFVGQSRTNFRVTGNQVTSAQYCKINNPLESTIDDKLSRINTSYRISFYKVIIFFLCIIFLLVITSLTYIKIITKNVGIGFNKELNIITSTNLLKQNVFLLYYQYYQYYQIKNYPQQILQIQAYNVPAMIKEYYSKANANIGVLLSFVLKNNNPQTSETYTKIFSSFSQEETTTVINLIDFLDSTKEALATNSPIFLVRNQDITQKIINSLISLDNGIVNDFTNSMFGFLLGIICTITVICVIIKVLYFKICFFKWNLFKIYQEIGENQINSYVKKLDEFISVLVNTKYYRRQGGNSEEISIGQDIGHIYKALPISKEIATKQKSRGVKKSNNLDKLMDKNLMILILIFTLVFFAMYFSQIQTYAKETQQVLDYSEQLQTFTVLILQRATQYFQAGMEAILAPSQRMGWQKAKKLSVPTQLTVKLPNYFNGYKQIQRGMLDFNLCSLYKNINCSLILDGIMDKSFTQSYSFLLQKLQEFGGIAIQDFGKQFRPHAKYPFYMQICYSRRTINNMLAFIQGKFNATLDGFLQYKQDSIQKIISVGFILIPLIIIISFYFAAQIKAECNFAIKCFKILPRKFIMKISMSKKLKNMGILDDIELIAA